MCVCFGRACFWSPVRPDAVLTTAALAFRFTQNVGQMCEFGVRFRISLLSTTRYNSFSALLFRFTKKMPIGINTQAGNSAVVLKRTGVPAGSAPVLGGALSVGMLPAYERTEAR